MDRNRALCTVGTSRRTRKHPGEWLWLISLIRNAYVQIMCGRSSRSSQLATMSIDRLTGIITHRWPIIGIFYLKKTKKSKVRAIRWSSRKHGSTRPSCYYSIYIEHESDSCFPGPLPYWYWYISLETEGWRGSNTHPPPATAKAFVPDIGTTVFLSIRVPIWFRINRDFRCDMKNMYLLYASSCGIYSVLLLHV